MEGLEMNIRSRYDYNGWKQDFLTVVVRNLRSLMPLAVDIEENLGLYLINLMTEMFKFLLSDSNFFPKVWASTMSFNRSWLLLSSL